LLPVNVVTASALRMPHKEPDFGRICELWGKHSQIAVEIPLIDGFHAASHRIWAAELHIVAIYWDLG
jgi:hypothetical protein